LAPTRQAAEGLEVGVLVVSGGRGDCGTGGEVVAGPAAGAAGGWSAQAPANAATTRTRGRIGRAPRTMGSGWHIVEEGDHRAVVHGSTDRRPRRPTMDPQEAARRWAATWTVAWQTHDVESVVALYTDDCVHRSTPFRPPHHRRQGVRDYLTQAFADEQRIDEVRFGTPVVQGDRAWVEYWAGFLDEHGTAMTLAGCAMARFAGDGRITEARDYWHLEHGHRPPPQEWGR
jgi:ketosteroid isomerase-like protein